LPLWKNSNAVGDVAVCLLAIIMQWSAVVGMFSKLHFYLAQRVGAWNLLRPSYFIAHINMSDFIAGKCSAKSDKKQYSSLFVIAQSSFNKRGIL